MRMEDLPAGAGITLYITVNEERLLTFESKITEIIPKKRSVLAEAVMRNGKVLTFKGTGISVSAVASIPDEKPLLFKDVSVDALKTDEASYCYRLTSPREGVPYNRRGNFRCFIGNPSPFYSKGSLTNVEVVIRDVSATGFAITCDPTLALENDNLVHVCLDDTLEDTGEKFTFHLYGLVVRKQELENGKIVYGCRLTSSVNGLERYLTKKERLRIRKARSS